MAGTNKILGMNKVMANLNKEILKIQARSMKGLIEGAIIIRRDMDQTPPLIPIDLGNLRASWFVTTMTGNVAGGGAKFKGKQSAALSSEHSEAQSSAGALVPHFKGPGLVMGFSANYAVFVHEKMEGDVNWNRPGSGAKFFEASLKRNTKKVLTAIQQNAIIKR